MGITKCVSHGTTTYLPAVALNYVTFQNPIITQVNEQGVAGVGVG